MTIEDLVKFTRCEPRDYQSTICAKTTDMFLGRYRNGTGEVEPSARSVMIESPTGSGKTVMAHLACMRLKQEFPDLVIGWVAMRRNLLSQAARENRELQINLPDVHYISMFDANPTPLLDARAAGRPMVMVVDEAQHDAASSMAHLHNICKPTMILGLTATPFRTDRVKLCFDRVVKDAGIHRLIQDGWLSRFHHYTIPDWLPETVADFYCSEPERWGKSIVYFHKWEDVQTFTNIVRSREREIMARLRAVRPDLRIGRSNLS